MQDSDRSSAGAGMMSRKSELPNERHSRKPGMALRYETFPANPAA